jgi:membrane protein
MAKRSFSRLVKILTGVSTGAETEFNRLERFAHFWVLVGRSFARNRCPVRAAALSYTSLLALIPLLAVAISVTSSLLKNQGEEKIYGAIDRLVSNFIPPATAELNTNSAAPALNLSPAMSVSLSPTNSIAAINAASLADGDTRVETAQKVVARDIHEFIQNTRSGALGVIGMLLLVYVAIQMLTSIESTFNDIWGITRGRNWLRRIVLYWTTITLGPLLIVGALGLAGGSHLQTTKNLTAQMPFVSDLIFEFLPFVVLWLAFTLIYLLVPNTKVRFGAALVGGAVGGSLWYLNNAFGFLYVSRVVSNSKIYGSLGLVPVFMVGLYFSWLILLFGAQVAYAFQNRKLYLQEKLVENVNQRGREFIALRLMTLIGGRFQQGEPAATLQQISTELGIPTKLAQQVLQPLLAARLVIEIAGPELAYLPARPLDAINAHHVLRAVRAGAGQDIATRDEPSRAEVLGEFAKIEEAERIAASSVTLLALVNRMPKQIEDADTKSK